LQNISNHYQELYFQLMILLWKMCFIVKPVKTKKYPGISCASFKFTFEAHFTNSSKYNKQLD